MVLGLSWILNFNYREKLRLLLENRILWWLPALLLLHLVFLINTEDFDYAWHDINIKIPLFVIPFTIATTAHPDKKELRWILGIYCAAVLAGALIVIGKYIASEAGWIERVLDHRHFSTFTSHIRFSLMICFCIAVLCVVWKKGMLNGWLCLLICTILISSMVLLEAITGLITLLAIALPIIMMLFGWEYRKNAKRIGLIIFCGGAIIAAYFTYELCDIFIPKKNQKIEKQSAAGNIYEYDDSPFKENGYYIWRNISRKEMREGWDKRSALKFDSLDRKGQPIAGTLLRYLTSLGLKKDSQGLAQLSQDDIINIENGEANAVNASANPLRKRIRELLWEIDMYLSGAEVSHNSLTQRFIYWRTGSEILYKNYLWGVGTGDVQQAFNQQYESDKSTLETELRRHTHNQYLTLWISFGTIGLLFFLYMLSDLYKYRSRLEHAFLAKVFLLIILISMLSEDTLETQAGVSFFVFFFALLWRIQSPTDSADQHRINP